MNILLTNDDGYFAPGLNELKKILDKYGDVYVVAPHFAQSGKSCAISFINELVIHQISEKVWSVEGTPADCVIVAMEVLKDIKIDLVVSGCNNGYNLTYDSLYSGTCGACYQALMFNLPAIAFSVHRFVDTPTQINEDMENVFKMVLEKNLLSSKYFLNVNMQAAEFEKPKGIKFTKLYPRLSNFHATLLNKAKQTYKYNHDYFYDESRVEFDVSATRQGYISITPLDLPSGVTEVIDKNS